MRNTVSKSSHVKSTYCKSMCQLAFIPFCWSNFLTLFYFLFFLGPLHSVTAARSGQAIIGCTVWINCCADESPNILLVAHDPCWAMQHLGLHWLKDRVCKAKHGAFFFFDDCELLDPELNRGDGLNTLIQSQEGNAEVVLLVSVGPYFKVQDRVASCVHLEEITPTLIFSPSLLCIRRALRRKFENVHRSITALRSPDLVFIFAWMPDMDGGGRGAGV